MKPIDMTDYEVGLILGNACDMAFAVYQDASTTENLKSLRKAESAYVSFQVDLIYKRNAI